MHRKKQFVSNVFKYLIAVSSVAGTLGVWNLLANKDLVNANSQANSNGQTISTTDLAPLPTLVPLLKVNVSSSVTDGSTLVTVQTPVTTSLREVAQPVVQPSNSTTITLPSSGNQNAPVILPPAPVTTTQSSKP